MKHPSYLLNPGDLFQVDPERVMFATGAPKNKTERREGRLAKRATADAQKLVETAPGEAADDSQRTPNEGTSTAADKVKEEQDLRETLKSLLAQAKAVLSRDKDVLPAKHKQEIRGFQRAVRSVLSRSTASSVLTDNLETQFSELISLLRVKRASSSNGQAAGSRPSESSSTTSSSSSSEPTSLAAPQSGSVRDELKEAFQKAAQGSAGLDEEAVAELSESELAVLRRALEQLRDNPIDSSKPYATPWRPREYMSAFAFIPRYLEVNQNICAAVYLRHPVARPGVSEVPTPFPESVGTAAFAWYLRRR
jgi:ribosomal protein S4